MHAHTHTHTCAYTLTPHTHIRTHTHTHTSRQDLMLIPELAVNPLGTRIIEAFFTDE